MARRLRTLTSGLAETLRLAREVRSAPDGRPKKAKLPGRRLVYLDLGLHTTARQVFLVMQWLRDIKELTIYGFEANPQHCSTAQSTFRNFNNVHIINVALVGPNHQGKEIELFVDDNGSGKGDTLLSQRGDTLGYRRIKVPAIRLSKFFQKKNIDPKRDTLILRMNIEGAEVYVLEDLEESGMINSIDAFYGSWNDAAKIDPGLAKRLENVKSRNKIRNIQFNDRDVGGINGVLRSLVIRRSIIRTIANAGW